MFEELTPLCTIPSGNRRGRLHYPDTKTRQRQYNTHMRFLRKIIVNRIQQYGNRITQND
jgi:hypothetical protein